MHNTIRRRVLRVHSVILIVVGGASAAVATIGWLMAVGPYAFLHDQRIGHVGLIQAYLLAMLLVVVLWLGSRQPTPVAWNAVGAGVQLCILVAYVLHWDFLPTLGPGMLTVRTFCLIVHIGLVLLETWAIFGLRESAPRAKGLINPRITRPAGARDTEMLLP
jgi:hypothetical protein